MCLIREKQHSFKDMMHNNKIRMSDTTMSNHNQLSEVVAETITTANNAGQNWTCKRCQHLSSSKCNLLKHLRRQTPCHDVENIISIDDYIAELLRKEYNDKTYDCNFCGTKFNKYQNRHRHLKTCKEAKKHHEQAGDILRKTNEELIEARREIAALKKENESLRLLPNAAISNHRTKHAKDKITPSVKYACWDKYVGKDKGTTMCLCCKRIEISQLIFECGHVLAKSDGGSLAIDNLRPICHKCNNSMGTMNMDEFIAQHGF